MSSSGVRILAIDEKNAITQMANLIEKGKFKKARKVGYDFLKSHDSKKIALSRFWVILGVAEWLIKPGSKDKLGPIESLIKSYPEYANTTHIDWREISTFGVRSSGPRDPSIIWSHRCQQNPTNPS